MWNIWNVSVCVLWCNEMNEEIEKCSLWKGKTFLSKEFFRVKLFSLKRGRRILKISKAVGRKLKKVRFCEVKVTCITFFFNVWEKWNNPNICFTLTFTRNFYFMRKIILFFSLFTFIEQNVELLKRALTQKWRRYEGNKQQKCFFDD